MTTTSSEPSASPLSIWMGEQSIDDEGLAKKAGVTRTMVSMLRRGRTKPSLDLAKRLSKITGLTPAALLPQEWHQVATD